MRDDDHGFTVWAVAAWPRLLRTATALTAGDHHLAEDLVQTALAKTYAAWGRVRLDEAHGEHPDRFVHRVLVRAFVDETRRPWWRRERRRADDPVPDLPEPVPDRPDDNVALRAALAALPPDQRAAVVLRHWLGHDVPETAALLRCPEATVRSRTHRGLARLRELLGDDDLVPKADAVPADPARVDAAPIEVPAIEVPAIEVTPEVPPGVARTVTRDAAPTKGGRR